MKQIIVMRGDLRNKEGHKVRTGKLIAQGAHASMGAILPYVRPWTGRFGTEGEYLEKSYRVDKWLEGSFTKVTVKVNSEEELLEVVAKAEEAGVINCLITDAGRTEFDGPTVTCAAIGPDTDEALGPITGKLSLL